MTLLNRHRELVAKLKSVRYLHVVREYNAAADSLAGEALASKVSKVVLHDHRKTDLKKLNGIQEMIYEPSSDDIKDENASSETFTQIPEGKTRYIHAMDSDIVLQRKTYADFAHEEHAEVSATTRSQTKTKKKRVHFEDEVPEGTTNTEATEAVNENSETQEQRPSAEVRHELTADDIDPVTVQEERRRRIAKAQDEELRWSNLKAVLRGETTAMTYKETREAWKGADNFVLQRPVLHECEQKKGRRKQARDVVEARGANHNDPRTIQEVLHNCHDSIKGGHQGVVRSYQRVKHDYYWIGLYAVSRRKVDENQPEMSLRLVMPTTMIQEVLHNCHDSIEGGHQGVSETDYYWIGLYAHVEKHVKSCLDCSSSKSLPQLKGYSPGNVLAERSFQVCSFTGFVITKAMSDTAALTVAKVFEECIYRRFGAPSLVRPRPRSTLHERGQR
ncbi:hypothetical protein PHMEG_00015079 [Phytophthora megakarya]|uniref:Integrase zinc-binding domain-containing protein n=1 Tax=Phytophthora megakarya TaxID=4795 RepID=A0A225W284_9STRA|nr:hypothetical protein PHMEG_00015079 [Phytophthora megakarya]